MSTHGQTEMDTFDDSASNLDSEFSYSSQPYHMMPSTTPLRGAQHEGAPTSSIATHLASTGRHPLPANALMLNASGQLNTSLQNAIGSSNGGVSGGGSVVPYDSSRARPGRPPARADTELSTEELRRRNRRRQRNREAAQRCRQRRIDQIDVLKQECDELKDGRRKLERENDKLKQELRKLKFQIELHEHNAMPATAPTGAAVPRMMTSLQPMVPAIKMEAPHSQTIGHFSAIPAASYQHPLHMESTRPSQQPPVTTATASSATSSISPVSSTPTSTTPSAVTSSPPITALKIPTSLPATAFQAHAAANGLVPLMSPLGISAHPQGVPHFVYAGPILSPAASGLLHPHAAATMAGQPSPSPLLFTPLASMPSMFTFPQVPQEVLEKARNESLTEFNKLAAVETVSSVGGSSGGGNEQRHKET